LYVPRFSQLPSGLPRIRPERYVPTLVIAGEFDTWSYPQDRETLMRDLANAPVKKSVLIKEVTHFHAL